MAEQIRDIAEQEPAEIRLQIDETRSAITEKLEALEEQVAGTVQDAKDSVQETIDSARESVQDTIATVKDTVQNTVAGVKETFDLRLQVERHPWPMLGGSLVAGVLAGALFEGARHRRRMPRDRMASEGQPLIRDREPLSRAPAPDYPSNVAKETPRPGMFDRFHEEIDQVKGLALGMLFGLVRDAIKDSVPNMAEQIGDVMDRITTKLGGAPVRGPVLQPQEAGRQENGRSSYSTVH